MYDGITKMVLEQYKDKIDVSCGLEEYFKGFTKDELISMLGRCCACNDYDNSEEIFLLQTKQKDDVVSYVIQHISDLYDGMFQYIAKNYFNYFKKIIQSNGYLRISMDEFQFSISFVMFLRDLLLAKIHYYSEDDEIEIYMPKEILNSIKKLVNNRGIVKKNEKNSEIISDIECLIDTYGLIDYDSLYNIYNDVFQKIDKKVLFSIISIYSLLSEGINIFFGDDMKLIGGVNFHDEDEVFSYYYSIEGDYKVFTKEEYYSIWNKSYITRIDGYFDLIDYLTYNYDMYEEDIDGFCELVLVDYLYSCMENDESSAKKSLMSKLDDVFEDITIQDKSKIGKLCEKIYLNYPNWKCRGYSILEKEMVSNK